MSPSDLLRKTGLNVSTRQFRRYLASHIIPGVVTSKGGHYAIVGPVTPRRLINIRRRISRFRCRPGRKKLKYVAPIGKDPNDVKFSRLNLHRSMIEFAWWMDNCDPLETWSDEKKHTVLEELRIAAARLPID